MQVCESAEATSVRPRNRRRRHRRGPVGGMRQKDGAPLHRLPRPQAFHSNRSGKNLGRNRYAQLKKRV